MTAQQKALALIGDRLPTHGRRAAMAPSFLVQRRIDAATHLAHLIEPTHRIAHGWSLSGADDRRWMAARPTSHGWLQVDQQTLRSSCIGRVTA